jgi:uncharacterized protein
MPSSCAPPSSPAPAIPLTDDEIDDILYISRANELDELTPYLESLAIKYKASSDAIICAAVDPESGNTALHYASANGHLGVCG